MKKNNDKKKNESKLPPPPKIPGIDSSLIIRSSPSLIREDRSYPSNK